ncbi:Hsp70 family protein [Paenirhodobacter enshiensis]|uniref:Hsp70 family protein n=1 Tax=Paenirhodobacter enshiensis TaxID=1105367 RepID=UPI0035B4ED3C
MVTDILAIDYGTSNSAVAVFDQGAVRRIPVETGADTLPTAVFFPAGSGAMRIGQAAADALIDGTEGRYMRALKSVLGTSLFNESRPIGGKRRTLADITTAFLAELRERAERTSGLTFRRVLSGRPVHFHTADPERDARAEADLAACYRAAGYDEVAFLPEPEAAALAAGRNDPDLRTGLIVDIGGGTSDFTVFRREAGAIRIVASHGIRLGGTDFDHAASLAHAMPLLGQGGQLRREFGPELLPVPNGIYVELATWAKIPFLYTADTRRSVKQMAKLAVDKERMGRLVTVLEDELGHELAFAVEKGKIAANGAGQSGRIAMGFIEPRLSAPITAESLNDALSAYRTELRAAAAETLTRAAIPADEIDTVVLVGGSSLMLLVSEEAQALCPKARVTRAEAFTAVVDGLALATAG